MSAARSYKPSAGPVSGLPGINMPDGDLSKDDFKLIIDIAHREAGLVVHAHKEAMVRGRLTRRARELGLESVAAYCALLRSSGMRDELPGLLNALTTNHTAFYREAHHFTHLQQVALPALMPGGAQGSGRIRIWCSAASSGEEPYTIAATVNAFANGKPYRDLRILATDIDTEVLRRAEAAQYSGTSVNDLSQPQKTALMMQTDASGVATIGDPLRRLLTFRRLNIIEEWPMKGLFDVIFCRNMLIYFDQQTKKTIIERFISLMKPGAFLYLGHSEALPQSFDKLESCGRTVYRRL